MLSILLLLLSQTQVPEASPLLDRPVRTREMMRAGGRSGDPGLAFFEFAPASGAGMGAACAGTTPTGAKGEALTFPARGSVAECYSNDGQTLTQLASAQPRISSGRVDSTVLGIWQEAQRTNLLLQSRNQADASWTKTGVTCARTSTGMRNDANGATRCTATAPGGSVVQAIVLGSTAFAASAHIRGVTVTGAVNVTVNGGTNWFQANASPQKVRTDGKWQRLVPAETPGCTGLVGSLCLVVPQLTTTAANPSFGIQFANSGDAVDIDFAQLEASSTGIATSPIETTAATATRNSELPDMAMSPVLPTGVCIAATAVSQLPVSLDRLHGVPGDRAPGVATGSTSYSDSFYNSGWTAETTATSPISTNTAVASGVAINRAVTYYDPGTGKLNGCLNGTCGAGVAATWTPPSWTRYRLAGYDVTNGPINGVLTAVQLDPVAGKCSRYPQWSGGSVAAVGDSITCCPSSTVYGWPISLQTLYGATARVANFAVSGAVVSAIQTQFETKARGRFGTVAVMGGVNDLRASATGATIFATLQAIYDNARASGQRIVPLTTLCASGSGGWTGAMTTELLDLNTRIRNYCTANNVTCVETYSTALCTGTAIAAPYDFGDGLHLNQAGEDLLATFVQAAIP